MFPNVMRIDFTRDYGTYSEDLVAIFNIKKVSEEEVLRFIQSCEEFHPHIIVVTPEQWESVFSKEEE